MPTGYTVVLDEKVDEFEWLKATLVRNFGVAIYERDDPLDMPFEELDRRIRKPLDDNGYHKKELEKAKARMRDLKDPVQAPLLYKRGIASDLKNEEKRKDEAAKLKTRHDRAESLLKAVQKEDVSRFTKDVAGFGLDQLKLVEWETRPPKMEPLLAELSWIQKEIAHCEWEINYHTKEMAADKERYESRLEYWNAFCKDIAKLEKKYRKRE